LCDPACWTRGCFFDGNDCLEEYCAPGCQYSEIGDGKCDYDCYKSATCKHDETDCAGLEALLAEATGPYCDKANKCAWSRLHDGVCQAACDVESCGFDEGDNCDTTCPSECLNAYLNDGLCQLECYSAVCSYDNGECADFADALQFYDLNASCSDECSWRLVGDGYCDWNCRVESCLDDLHDCDDYCAPGCLNSMLGDGKCQYECYNEACAALGGEGWGLSANSTNSTANNTQNDCAA
jgi:hypothetical protein